jgi:fructokinase
MRCGIDVGGTKIETAILSDSGEFLSRERTNTPKNYAALLNSIDKIFQQASKKTGFDGPVGICMPGSVSNETGLIQGANTTYLNGQNFQKNLQATLNRSVRLSNDANCFALSEAIEGAGKGASVVFGVIIGTGCGGGIVVNRHIIAGVNGIAGEWGHTPLPWPVESEFENHDCWCGKTGCLETYISGTALVKDYKRMTGLEKDGKQIVLDCKNGDIVAEAVLQALEDRIARGLAMIINIIDPDIIILGGGLSNIERLYENVPRKWAGYVFSNKINTRLLKPKYGDSSGVRGAALLFGTN